MNNEPNISEFQVRRFLKLVEERSERLNERGAQFVIGTVEAEIAELMPHGEGILKYLNTKDFESIDDIVANSGELDEI